VITAAAFDHKFVDLAHHRVMAGVEPGRLQPFEELSERSKCTDASAHGDVAEGGRHERLAGAGSDGDRLQHLTRRGQSVGAFKSPVKEVRPCRLSVPWRYGAAACDEHRTVSLYLRDGPSPADDDVTVVWDSPRIDCRGV
jgi:hypothetical protein